jgi:hypothetical protein
MLQRMAAPLEKVCAGTRDVLWRWPHCSWWINKMKLFFGTSLITLLSDHVHKKLGGKVRVDEYISSEVRKYCIVFQYLKNAERARSILKDRSSRVKC